MRFEIGLRLCRELILSEEWLATGEFKALDAVARKRHGAGSSSGSRLHKIFFRHCFDLWSEPITRTIPPRTLFSTAFDEYLAPVNTLIAASHLYGPRMVPSPHDGVEIARNILDAHLDGRLFLLANEAARLGAEEGDVQRSFLRCVFEASEIIWKRFIGLPTPEVATMNWLRSLTKFVDAPIGPLADHPELVPPVKAHKSKGSRVVKKQALDASS